ALDRAEVRSSQFHWVGDPPVVLAGDRQGVVFDQLRAHDGDARLEIDGRWAAPQGYYDWKMVTRSLDLSRIGMPAEWQLAGLADLSVEVHGVPGNPRWTVFGTCARPGWQGHRADSASIALAGSPGALELRHGTFHLDGGALTAEARFEPPPATWSDSRTGLS